MFYFLPKIGGLKQMNLKNILSKRDLIDILELIHKSLSSSKDMHLIELINELNCMIPFDYAIYVLSAVLKYTTSAVLSAPLINANLVF